jgi:tetratricopeptide (TPR) repeat protein
MALAADQNQLPQQTARPQPPRAVLQAQAALEQGSSAEAIRILSGFLADHPKDGAARILLGQAFAVSGENDRAEAEYQRVLIDSPNNYTAMAALGDLFIRTGQSERAEPMLAKAARASGGIPEIRMQWAVVLARLHRFKEAQNALAGLPPPKEPSERIIFHRLKAAVAAGLGDDAFAALEMEKAFDLKQDDMGLRLATAVAELQSGKLSRAAALAEPVFSASHDPQAGLVLLQAQLGMHADFHATLQALLSIPLNSAEEPAFRQRLAKVLVSHGEFSEAIEDLKKAAMIDPGRADLAFNLALAQYKAGRIEDALESAEKCKTIGDSAELEDLLGDLQEARGDYLAAVQGYQAAVGLAPTEERYRLSLAVEFIRHRNYDAAKVVLQQADGLWPNSWKIKLALGMAEYIAGGNEEAIQLLVRAVELSPQPEAALRFLGDIELNLASEPDSAAISALCGYSDSHPKNGKMKFYCAAAVFRKDNATGDKSHTGKIIANLRSSAGLLHDDPAPHCQLGRVYRWVEQWELAREEWETCARLDSDLAEAHFRLTEIYHHLGQQELSEKEKRLFQAASKRIADENASREEAIRSFLYTIQKEEPGHN